MASRSSRRWQTRGRARRVGALVAALLAAATCGQVYPGKVFERDGRQYGVTPGFIWRSTWWNFYQRGQSYAEGGYLYLNDAIRDFRSAIDLRDRDQRDARTYGMHFLDDYFPHRELGIALFGKTEYAEAERELETSVAHTPSSRASFYLNRVREELLRRDSKAQAVPPPEIKIERPADGAVTRDLSVWVIGRARSPNYVAAVEVQGERQPVELAVKDVPFRVQVRLAAGTNRIRISANDLLGAWRQTEVRLNADWEGPVVSIADIREVEDTGEIEFTGKVQDAAGVTALKVGNRPLEQPAGRSVEIRTRLPLPPDDRLDFYAEDTLGNKTEGTILLDRRPPRPPSAEGSRPPDILLASLMDLGGSLPLGFSLPGRGVDAAPTSLFASNGIGWRVKERARGLEDESPPILTVRDMPEKQTVFVNRLFVQCSASDDQEVRSVEVNGEPITLSPGKEVIFSRTIPLAMGENRLVFAAVDGTGKRTEKVLIVRRNPSATEDRSVRLFVAALPFKQGEGMGDLSDQLQDDLVQAIMDQGRFQVVERTRLKEILEEHDLTASGLMSKDSAPRLGKITGADAMLLGRVYRRGASIEARVDMVDTETTEMIVTTKDAFAEDESRGGGTQALMAGLARKLALAVPLIESPVIDVKGGTVRVKKGEGESVVVRQKMMIFRKGDDVRDAVTGEPLRAPQKELARGRIVGVTEDLWEAEVSPLKKEAGAVRAGDLAVTR